MAVCKRINENFIRTNLSKPVTAYNKPDTEPLIHVRMVFCMMLVVSGSKEPKVQYFVLNNIQKHIFS